MHTPNAFSIKCFESGKLPSLYICPSSCTVEDETREKTIKEKTGELPLSNHTNIILIRIKAQQLAASNKLGRDDS